LGLEELLSRYGEDNARYLAEQLGNLTRNYTGLTYIEMGMALIRALVDGPWDEERFLVVRPGERIVPSYDEQIVRAEPA